MKNTFLFDKSDKKTFEYFESQKNKISANADELILNNHLHPHGIKELVEPKPVRVAKSILLLIHAMDKGTIDERLEALHSLRDEVLISSENSMPKNTGRILLSIMKDLARTEDETRQLELLHDFTMLTHAKGRTVRKFLAKYNLLEMPEEWNQISFDHHVHDSYTKGRKTPTHLIMDAWIKGIKRLTVIYYDFVPEVAARELLTAALYMGIKVRIGIECTVKFNEKTVRLIWTPGKLPDAEHWTAFLTRPDVVSFGKKALASLDFQKRLTETTAMYKSPGDLLKRIEKLDPDYKITLNLAGLTDVEVLELLYECEGRITNIEIFNTKNFYAGKDNYTSKIRKISRCINEKDAPKLKKIIKKMINYQKSLTGEEKSNVSFHVKHLNQILVHLNDLFLYYSYTVLLDRWGTDSIGKASEERNGMGFALLETLPVTAQKIVLKNKEKKLLPVHIQTMYRENFLPITHKKISFKPRLQKIGGEWITQSNSDTKGKNLVALGEYDAEYEIKKSLEAKKTKHGLGYIRKYMPTGCKSIIKVFCGFIPAFLSFYLTKDWWVLMYLGAPIWFAITGGRNIIQAVVSGDSRHRSPLLHWTGYINWSRIADSLLYSGLSVPLLDFFVNTWLLKQKLHITVATNPILAFTIMSLVNGIYISSHNLLRGLPKSDVIANFFRSILSIPLAFVLSSFVGFSLNLAGNSAVDDILQKWTAIMSKVASDTVGGIIEGLSNRQKNIKLRYVDYQRKFVQFKRTCNHLEFMFPKKDLLKVLKNPGELVDVVKKENPQLLKKMIFDALDFFYFWLFQPHARTVLISILHKMNKRSRNTFLNFQNVLKCNNAVTELLTNGYGDLNFEKVLKLYKEQGTLYVATMNRLLNGGKWYDSLENLESSELAENEENEESTK